MNRQVRRLAIVLMVVYLALFVQLNVVTVVRADEYRDHPDNTRALQRDFGRPRGSIVTADGVVAAESVEVTGDFERLRRYPEGDLYAHSVGYLSFDFGAGGLERTLNDLLSGASDEVSLQTFGDLLFDSERTADVMLTLRDDVQKVAKEALGERKGSVVALDPRDGSVLALWTWPAFDPNLLSSHDLAAVSDYREVLLDDPDTPLLAKAYRERFAPGSTFKVVTATAGLETGTVTQDEPVYPDVTEYVPPQTERPIRNFGGASCGGALAEILARSCNTSFAEMAIDIGAEPMETTARSFGFDDTPPIDLPDPADSVFPDADFFEVNQPLLAQSGIGQFEVAATPLQMALVAAAVANDGVVMEPGVVAEIRDSDGRLVESLDPRVWHQAMDVATAETMRNLMVGVVENGTASSVGLPGVRVGAKTGTAELSQERDDTHAWMIAFAPAEAPTVAVAVIVEGEEGLGTQTGGSVAGPVARAVLEAALVPVATPTEGAESTTESG